MLTCTGVPEEPFRILNPPPCDSLNENQSYDLQQSNSLASTTVNATLEVKTRITYYKAFETTFPMLYNLG